jgi:hypothetical protein
MILPLKSRIPAHIQLFTDRASYLAAFGKPAPPFDFSQPVKDWIDTRKHTDPDAEVSYSGIRYEPNGEPVYDASRTVATREFRLFPEIAASVNLLPEPVPAQGSLTPNQLAMIQRKRPWPLELKPGEKVVLAPGIGTIPAIDDGTTPAAIGGAITVAEMSVLADLIADKVAARLGFPKPQ